MKISHMPKIIAFLGLTAVFMLAGCSNTTSTSSSSEARTIDTANYEIIFVGEEEADVTFQHKEHSDRFDGDCFECHSCGDVVGEIYWNCRDCHSPSDPEQLCNEDEYHGCTYAQCYYCHEDLAHNPGLSCGACHTP